LDVQLGAVLSTEFDKSRRSPIDSIGDGDVAAHVHRIEAYPPTAGNGTFTAPLPTDCGG